MPHRALTGIGHPGRPSGRGVPPVLLLGLLLLPFVPTLGGAQQTGTDDIRREIIESQQRLEEVREERARLQREMEQLRSRVRDVSGELRNIERQLSASRSVLAEIDFQVEATAERVRESTADLLRTRSELRAQQAALQRRMREIYKRGPLHTVEVILGADSFADLLNRYRYLHLIALYDRSLVEAVRTLEVELEAQSREMRESLAELDRLRQFQVGEVAELRQIEAERQQTLTQFRSREERTLTTLEELEQTEARLTAAMADLERRRLEMERRAREAGAITGPATLTPADQGLLDWPVEGELAYRFGVERRPNNTVLRWNGVGIRASIGTPVRAVRDGTVVLAGPFEGYGPTVIVSHGEGFYTLYLYLEEIGVVEGRAVRGGQVVGTVGGGGTYQGPHMEFQIRVPVAGGTPQARDPLDWLLPRGGGP